MSDYEWLDEAIRKHNRWLHRSSNGGWFYYKGFRLEGTDISGANLWQAILAGSSFTKVHMAGATLAKSDMRGTFLYKCDCSNADFRSANLAGAQIWDCDVSGANFLDANLQGADIRSTDFSEAKNAELALSRLKECPEEGSFIAFAKTWGLDERGRQKEVIMSLKVPEDAKRGGSFGRKCMASKATIVRVEDLKGNVMTGYLVSPNLGSLDFLYAPTKELQDVEFYLTRQEAVGRSIVAKTGYYEIPRGVNLFEVKKCPGCDREVIND